MSGLSLSIDAARWRHHLESVLSAGPAVVPVAKGNGYGFGLARLAQQAENLGCDTLAVGMAEEVRAVRDHTGADIVILTPWRPGDPRADALVDDPRIITTVSRLRDLEHLQASGRPVRWLGEVLTSMKRHGMNAQDQHAALAADVGTFEGWTIHLPLLDQGRYDEGLRLAKQALDVRRAPLWVSHLTQDEANRLAGELQVPVRLRLGTRLWLGEPGALTTHATVWDLHPVRRGEKVGYRQRRVPADGWLLVLAGGTAHGVGLEAPTSAASVRSRAVSVATGSLEAAGLALSPYTIAGKKRWFIEPPHMQSSLVFLPKRVTPPSVGDQVPVELRLTTATVDDVTEN